MAPAAMPCTLATARAGDGSYRTQLRHPHLALLRRCMRTGCPTRAPTAVLAATGRAGPQQQRPERTPAAQQQAQAQEDREHVPQHRQQRAEPRQPRGWLAVALAAAATAGGALAAPAALADEAAVAYNAAGQTEVLKTVAGGERGELCER